jgi:hypothetical protein
MGEVGDISTVLTLDEYEFMTGMRNATEATREFARESEHSAHAAGHAHGSLHRPLHKATHLAMAASFALSAGEGETGLVGGLEKASMLIPMIGMAFGPVGTMIGITGGLIATAFLGPLKAAQEEAKKFGEQLKHAGEEWSKLIEARGADVKFGQTVQRMADAGDVEGIEKQREQYEDQIKMADAKMAEARKKQAAVMAATGMFNTPDQHEHGLQVAGGISELFGSDNGNPAFHMPEENIEAIKQSRREIEKIEEEKRQGEERLHELEMAMDEARAAEARKLEDERQAQALENAKKLQEAYEAPFEKAKQKQEELDQAFRSGLINSDLYERGSKKIQENLAKEQSAENHAPGKNAMVRANSAEAYAAVREAIREQQGHKTPEVDALKQIVENTKVMAEKQKAARDAKEQDFEIPP